MGFDFGPVKSCRGYFQEKLVLPCLSKSYPITPARLNLIYEDVWLQSADGVRLHAWFIKMFPECRGPSPTILFFQENAGNSCIWKVPWGSRAYPKKNPSGLQDEMVPPFHMKILYAKAAGRNPQCTFVEFPRGMHMDTGCPVVTFTGKQTCVPDKKHAPDKKER